MRKRVNRKVDRRVIKKTTNNVKLINIKPKPMRGGIRL